MYDKSTRTVTINRGWKIHFLTLSLFCLLTLNKASTVMAAASSVSQAFVREVHIRLPGHLSALAQQSQPVSRLASTETISLALSLPLRNQAELTSLLQRISNPQDAEYGKYLTSEQFAARFSPTATDYKTVIAYVKSQGLTITGTHSNRLVLDVQGSTRAVESAFNVQMSRYRTTEGRVFQAPNTNPQVPVSIASRLIGIAGLDTAGVRRPHAVRQSNALTAKTIGSGPSGGLTPSNIKAAYNLSSVAEIGTGQTLALLELEPYAASDITAYANYFSLNNVPLQNVTVDGGLSSGMTSSGEAVLDIELQIAVAPGASKIMIYNAPNTDAGVIDAYNKMATDNVAKQISTSWGLDEASSGTATLNSEAAIFQQMAAQGQTIYAASGDTGAYDDGTSLSVDDPASQPYVTGVGGTKLSVTSSHTYSSETTWNNGSIRRGAGGGGISSVWSIPDYQKNSVTTASGASSTKRNVPDIALNSDPNTGYAIYYNGSWSVFGGTSCASPIMAGYTALVNQRRLANGKSVLGQANPTLYTLAQGSNVTLDFHDIADGSTNLYYSAISGYDLATGLGSINGANLLSALAPTSTTTPTTAPTAPTNLTATAGDTLVSLSWTASSTATSYTISRSTASGTGYAQISTTSGTSLTDTGLSDGTTYYYVVTASNSVGASGYSNEASATPTAVTTVSAPAAPTNLTAVAGNQKVTLSWSSSASAIEYEIYRSVASGTGYASIGSTSSTTFSDTGISNGTTYYYVVTATSSTGTSSYSNQASATPITPTVLFTYTAGPHFFSLPYDYTGVSLDTLFGYSGVTLAVWNNTTGVYAVTPTSPADQVQLGRGYWVRFPQAVTITATGAAASTSQDYSIGLTAGWNQIGIPFTSAIAINSLKVAYGGQTYSFTTASTTLALIHPTLFLYDGISAYTSVGASGTLQVGQGYWIYANFAETLIVPHP